MATFADMSTLLLTFFVLMLSFATIDIEKFREMLGSVAEAYGVTREVQGEFQAVLRDDQLDRLADEDMMIRAPEGRDEKIYDPEQLEAERKKKELAEMASRLEESIRQNQLGDDTEVLVGSSGIRIRVKGFHMFEAGRADIKGTVNPFLDAVYEGMKVFEYNLLIEGHTDNRPIRSGRYPSNWELSAARATRVARYLIDKGIDPKRLLAVGYADNYPIADNSNPVERAKNRRVEFVFTHKQVRMAIENQDT
jgi:chemotaxis protein MotB